MPIPRTIYIPGWRAVKVSNTVFRLTPNTKYITQTGSEVTTTIKIGYRHRLVRTAFRHTDGNDTDSKKLMTLKFSFREVGGIEPYELERVLHGNKTTYISQYGVGYEFPSGEYVLKTKTENGHRIYPVIYIQLLGVDD